MIIVRTIDELRELHEPGTGLVPTMGALHEGHLSLMRAARGECRSVVATLFVNPTQFGPGEDYASYPRTFERDVDLCRQAGVDVLFAPDKEEMYPEGFATSIAVSSVTSRWEGAYRPGHFEGVATIVAKLFHIARPKFAYFGWKDLQQCVVIARMVRDLNFPLTLRLMETIRADDGLALSSRNAYLSPEERSIAPELYRQLRLCRDAIQGDQNVQSSLDSALAALADSGFVVDYFAYVDLETLEPLSSRRSPSALVVAARLGRTRLIDNVRL